MIAGFAFAVAAFGTKAALIRRRIPFIPLIQLLPPARPPFHAGTPHDTELLHFPLSFAFPFPTPFTHY